MNVSVALLLSFGLVACSNHEGQGRPDLSPSNIDGSTGNHDPDLARVADLAPDMLASPSNDLTLADRAPLSDDLAPSDDLATAPSDDLTPPPSTDDLTMPTTGDLAKPADLVSAAGDMVVVKPVITTFTGPSSACTGTITLTYNFSGAPGIITPGNISVAAGASTIDVPLSTSTTVYTLTATNAAGMATQTTIVGAWPKPDATITAPINAAIGETKTMSTVQNPNVTYAWSIHPGDTSGAAIVGAANTYSANVTTTTPAKSYKIDVTVSNPGCSTSSTATVALPCDLPQIISYLPGVNPGDPATPEVGPDNFDTRRIDFRDVKNGWAPMLVPHTPGKQGPQNLTYARQVNGVWGPPSGAPHLINDPTYDVRGETKVATDDAGDAVFFWTQVPVGGSDAEGFLRGYNAKTNTWSAIQLVASDVIDWQTPAFVSLDKQSGDALLSWVQGPWGPAEIPHMRHYNVQTDTLGVDLPLRTSTTTYSYFIDLMSLDVKLNDSLTGIASWYEEDATSRIPSLYALHVTAGQPDQNPDGTFAIVTIAAGGSTNVNDAVNMSSLLGDGPMQEYESVAVAANDVGSIVWRVRNYASTTDASTVLHTRRYMGGAWGADEIVAEHPSLFGRVEWAIANDGTMLLVERANTNVLYTAAAPGTKFPPLTSIAGSGGSSTYIGMDSVTGRAIVELRDANVSSGIQGSATIFDPATLTLGPLFTYSDVINGSTVNSGRPFIDATGEARIVFMQISKTVTDTGDSAFLYVNSCRY